MALKAAEAHALRRGLSTWPGSCTGRAAARAQQASRVRRRAHGRSSPTPPARRPGRDRRGVRGAARHQQQPRLSFALYAQVGGGHPEGPDARLPVPALGREVGSSKELLVTETHELLDNFDALLASWMEESNPLSLIANLMLHKVTNWDTDSSQFPSQEDATDARRARRCQRVHLETPDAEDRARPARHLQPP